MFNKKIVKNSRSHLHVQLLAPTRKTQWRMLQPSSTAMLKEHVYWQDMADKESIFFGYVHFICKTFLWKNLFHNEDAVCQFNTLSAVKTHPPFIIIFINTRFPCCIIFFTSPFFLFPFQFIFFFLFFSWNKAFQALHVIINDIISISLLTFNSVCLAIAKILGG